MRIELTGKVNCLRHSPDDRPFPKWCKGKFIFSQLSQTQAASLWWLVEITTVLYFRWPPLIHSQLALPKPSRKRVARRCESGKIALFEWWNCQVKSAALDNCQTSNSAQNPTQVKLCCIIFTQSQAYDSWFKHIIWTAFCFSQRPLTSSQLPQTMSWKEGVAMRCELCVKNTMLTATLPHCSFLVTFQWYICICKIWVL